jgi:hypothetical protein
METNWKQMETKICKKSANQIMNVKLVKRILKVGLDYGNITKYV